MILVNLMYRYINKFMTSNELLAELKNINLSDFDLKAQMEIKNLILKVQEIVDTIPNEVDESEKKRVESFENILNILKEVEEFDNAAEKDKKLIGEQIPKIEKSLNELRDGGKLYEELFNLLTNNDLIVKYAMKMNDSELLDFITEYIYAPLPPVLDQEGFNDLVKVGISNDKREALFRLAFNYEKRNMDFSLIEDYYIEKKDAYYLIELISAVNENIDLEKIIEKVIKTGDKDFMKDCASRALKLGIITQEEIDKLNI